MPESTPKQIEITIPVAPISKSANLPLVIHTRLEPIHAAAWRSLLNGLRAAGETTAKGTPITSPDQALHWLLLQIGDRFDRLP